jgi:DNA polymerase elongation subunit (family B)
MCWAAKWQGETKIYFDSVFRSTPKTMAKGIHKLIEAADMVVHFNGTHFDIPTLNKEFLLHGIPPASPVCELDLLKVARKKFRFPSNKLDYMAQRLGLGEKYLHKGHDLWVGCMAKNPKDWVTMEKYNKHDVVLLERLYNKLRPWMSGHLNYSTLTESTVCPGCGSKSFQKRGYAYSQSSKYQRYQCKECYGWFRGKENKTVKFKRVVAL